MSKSLGRGLSALISENSVNSSKRDTLKISLISPGKFQPRTVFKEDELNELAESIKKNGIVQPVIVRKAEGGKYELIAGERRWRAAQKCGLSDIPAIVMDLDDKQALEVGLVENIQRSNLTLLEEAEGYKRLIDEFGYTQEELSSVLGKSRSQITNTLRLLTLPSSVKELLNYERITAGHARAIAASDRPEEVANRVVKDELNVRQTERLVKKLADLPQRQRNPRVAKDPELEKLEAQLAERLGLDINISNHGQKGKVTIKYHSLGELDSILQRLED